MALSVPLTERYLAHRPFRRLETFLGGLCHLENDCAVGVVSKPEHPRTILFCLGHIGFQPAALEPAALRRICFPWLRDFCCTRISGILVELQGRVDLRANKNCECAPVQPNHYCDG